MSAHEPTFVLTTTSIIPIVEPHAYGAARSGALVGSPAVDNVSGGAIGVVLRRFVQALRRGFQADQAQNSDRGWTYNLAIFRVVFLGAVALPFATSVARWTEHVMPNLPQDVWVPISYYRYLPFDLLVNAQIAHWLAVTNVVFIILALVGVHTRWTLGLATVLSVYMFGLIQNQGKVDHFHHVVWFMALLAVGPSGRFLSVDSIRLAIQNADRGLVEPPLPGRAALVTLRYCWLLFGVLYLFPGLAKLEAALTRGWTSSETLQAILWRKWFELQLYEPGFTLPVRVDELPPILLCLAGIGVILFELAFVTLVLFRRFRPFLAFSGLAFHLGNGLILHIPFTELMVAYVCLIDWTKLGRVLLRIREPAPLIVLYDGGCHLCRRTLAVLRSIDLCDDLEPIDGFSGDPRRQRFPHLTDHMLAHDLYAVRDQKTVGGYEAYQWIAARLPLLWLAAPVMRWRPVLNVGQEIYRRVADSRTCLLVDRESRRPAVNATTTRLPHWVGGVLLVSEIGISALDLVSGVATEHLGRRHPLPEVLTAVSWRFTIRWPFDLYPLFAQTPERQIEIWEPRIVLVGEREIRIGPSSYAAVFGHPAKCWMAAWAVKRETDVERHRARSLDLIRLLWQFESSELRQAAVEVRVYHSKWSTEPLVGTILDERLVERFPIGVITAKTDH